MKAEFCSLADIKVGHAFASASFSRDPKFVRLLRGTNVGTGRPNWSDTQHWDVDTLPVDEDLYLRVDDVVIAMDASFTSSGVLRASRILGDDLPALLVQRVARIRPKKGNDGDFLWYLVRSEQFSKAITAQQTGSVISHISAAQIGSVELDVPEYSTQMAIAEVLRALDDKIESNRRILETAKRLITAEYQYVVSSIDDEPYGVRLDVQMGAPFKGEYFSEIGYGRPLIRIRDLKTFSSQVWTTESRADEFGIVPGDILVGMDAEFRSTIWLGDAGVLNQRMCRFVPRKGVSRSFAWLAIRPELEYCERAKSGTTVIHLNKGDIDRFRVPRLSDEQHGELSMATEPVFDRLVVAGREISSLSGLRDALLPELLAGRLQVRDAEKVVEGAV